MEAVASEDVEAVEADSKRKVRTFDTLLRLKMLQIQYILLNNSIVDVFSQ